MPYTVLIKHSALKELAILPKSVRIRIRSKIDSLSSDPRAGARKIQGQTNLWRMRVGEYRIVYGIDEGIVTVTIVRVAHRKDVYR